MTRIIYLISLVSSFLNLQSKPLLDLIANQDVGICFSSICKWLGKS